MLFIAICLIKLTFCAAIVGAAVEHKGKTNQSSGRLSGSKMVNLQATGFCLCVGDKLRCDIRLLNDNVAPLIILYRCTIQLQLRKSSGNAAIKTSALARRSGC